MRIPAHGIGRDHVRTALESFRAHDVKWQTGRTWAYVYDAGDEAKDVAAESFTAYMGENALDPTAFPSMLALETQIVAMVAHHASAPESVVGNFTSGGTESIFCAMKAARDWARATKPHISRPQVLLPHTAHASFHKVAHFLCLDVVTVPVDLNTYQADPVAMRAAVTPDTIMIVGSAVSYAHGVVDPIAELGAIAEDHGLWLHVDGCIGGFLLPYFRRFGGEFPVYDFAIPQVTSMSIDLHKYAFAPKGASVVLYRDASYRQYAFYACSGWSGYTVVNTTVQSTKGGGPLAAAWAMLNYFGDDGYEALFGRCWDATRRLVDGVREIPDLRVLVEPHSNLLAFTSDTVSVFHICDEMKFRGWFIQPQLAFGGSKENIHLSINPKAVECVEPMLADLRDCVDAARALPSGQLAAAVEPMLTDLPPGGLTPEMFASLLGAVGVQGTSLPDRMAPINEVLNVLPPRVREQMLIAFVNSLYVAS